MNDETLQRLPEITDRLIELCDWLKERWNFDTASRLIPVADNLTVAAAKVDVKRQ